MNEFIFEYDSVQPLTHDDDGHYYLHVPAFYGNDDFSNYVINFIFDTGAYITVLSRKTIIRMGLDEKFTVEKNTPLSGFAGKTLVDIKEIPGFVIGGRRLEGVKVAVPHINTDENILGLNVLEYFKYFVDTENDKIYFAQNLNPDIHEPLQAKRIYKLLR